MDKNNDEAAFLEKYGQLSYGQLLGMKKKEHWGKSAIKNGFADALIDRKKLEQTQEVQKAQHDQPSAKCRWKLFQNASQDIMTKVLVVVFSGLILFGLGKLLGIQLR